MFEKKTKPSNTNSSSNKEPFFKPAVQPKLKMGQQGDKYEAEADQMADKVVSGNSTDKGDIQKKDKDNIQQKPLVADVTPFIQKMESEEEPVQKMSKEEEGIQKKEEGEPVQMKGSKGSGSQNIANSLKKGTGGAKMDSNTKSSMEQGFGTDLSNVNIHTDSNAVQMNKDINAQAFTNGNDIYFNSGKYDPNSKKGQHLLAHELTHTIQQKGENNIQRQIDYPEINNYIGDTSYVWDNDSFLNVTPKATLGNDTKELNDSRPTYFNVTEGESGRMYSELSYNMMEDWWFNYNHHGDSNFNLRYETGIDGQVKFVESEYGSNSSAREDWSEDAENQPKVQQIQILKSDIDDKTAMMKFDIATTEKSEEAEQVDTFSESSDSNLGIGFSFEGDHTIEFNFSPNIGANVSGEANADVETSRINLMNFIPLLGQWKYAQKAIKALKKINALKKAGVAIDMLNDIIDALDIEINLKLGLKAALEFNVGFQLEIALLNQWRIAYELSAGYHSNSEETSDRTTTTRWNRTTGGSMFTKFFEFGLDVKQLPPEPLSSVGPVDILFETGKYTVVPGSQRRLERWWSAIPAHIRKDIVDGRITFQFDGEASKLGGERKNMQLSRDRAIAVRNAIFMVAYDTELSLVPSELSYLVAPHGEQEANGIQDNDPFDRHVKISLLQR